MSYLNKKLQLAEIKNKYVIIYYNLPLGSEKKMISVIISKSYNRNILNLKHFGVNVKLFLSGGSLGPPSLQSPASLSCLCNFYYLKKKNKEKKV